MDVVEIILAPEGGSSKVLETLKSSFSLSSSHKFLEEIMISKQKQLTEVQQVKHLSYQNWNHISSLFNIFLCFQVLKLCLHEKSEDILRIRSFLQSISPLCPVVKENSQDLEPNNDDKFDPKLVSSTKKHLKSWTSFIGFRSIPSTFEPFFYIGYCWTSKHHQFEWGTRLSWNDGFHLDCIVETSSTRTLFVSPLCIIYMDTNTI